MIDLTINQEYTINGCQATIMLTPGGAARGTFDSTHRPTTFRLFIQIEPGSSFYIYGDGISLEKGYKLNYLEADADKRGKIQSWLDNQKTLCDGTC